MIRYRSFGLASALTTAALGLRVLYLLNTEIASPFRSDAAEYARYAVNLLEHSTFSRLDPSAPAPTPDAFRAPGYPLFLAACFGLFGIESGVDWVYAIQALLSAALVPLTLVVGRGFLPGWAAWSAAALVAVSPHLISFTGYLLTEILFSLALLVPLVLYQARLTTRRPAEFFGIGVLFGAATLVNSVALPVGCIAAVALIASPIGQPLRWRAVLRHAHRSAAVAVASGSLLLPGIWSLRNLGLDAGSRGGSDRFLATAIHGSYPDFVYRDPRLRYYAYREDPRFREMMRSFPDFIRILSQRASERPLRYASWYLAEKPIILWTWNMLQGVDDVYVYPLERYGFAEVALLNGIRVSMKGLHPILLALAAIGIPLFAARPRRLRDDPEQGPTPRFLLILLAYWTIVYAISAPWPRYAVPLRPELYLWVLFSVSRALPVISAWTGTPLRSSS
jgi:hypothetical protein